MFILGEALRSYVYRRFFVRKKALMPRKKIFACSFKEECTYSFSTFTYMAKKKKVFKTAALAQSNRSREQRLRENLTQAVNGQSRLLHRRKLRYRRWSLCHRRLRTLLCKVLLWIILQEFFSFS